MNRRNFLLGLIITPAAASLPVLRPAAPPLAKFYPPEPGLRKPPGRYIEITRAGIYHLSTAFAGLAIPGLYELQAEGVALASVEVCDSPMLPCTEFELQAMAEMQPGQRVHWPAVPEGCELEAHIRVARIGDVR